jgi:hypothetical protein
VIYALLTVLGSIPATNTAFGLVPIYGHDVGCMRCSRWLRCTLGLLGRDHGGAAA